MKHDLFFGNPPIKIYMNKMEKRITIRIKAGFYFDLLAPETMNLLGRTENRKIKDKNGEIVPHLVITEVILVHCNIVDND